MTDGLTVTVEQSSEAVNVCCVGSESSQLISAIADGAASNTGDALSASTSKLTEVVVLLPQASVAVQM